MSNEILRSNKWIEIINSLIQRFENINPMQYKVGCFYTEMLIDIFREMDEHI